MTSWWVYFPSWLSSQWFPEPFCRGRCWWSSAQRIGRKKLYLQTCLTILILQYHKSFPLKRNECHLLKIVTLDLLHEMGGNLHLALQNQLQTLLHWSFSHTNQVPHSNYSCQLQVSCMNKYFSSPDNGWLDEPIGETIKLFYVFLCVIVQIDV